MSPNQSKQPLTGLDIAAQWAQLPPEHLRIAFKALEPELQRAHEQEQAKIKAETERMKLRLTYRLQMGGLAAGFIIATGMLGAAVLLGINHQPWLAGALAGPSVLALVKIFVLNKSDATDMRHVSQQAQQKSAPASQGTPAVEPPPPI